MFPPLRVIPGAAVADDDDEDDATGSVVSFSLLGNDGGGCGLYACPPDEPEPTPESNPSGSPPNKSTGCFFPANEAGFFGTGGGAFFTWS